MSNGESIFLTEGRAVIGEPNHITTLIKFIGKYDTLCNEGNGEQIKDYDPAQHLRFVYENHGYSVMNNILKENHPHSCVGRRFIKALSRKWSPETVIISFDTVLIINEIFSYISRHTPLQEACLAYLQGIAPRWAHIMPIQHDFIQVRSGNGGKDMEKAERIIVNLASISIQDIFRG